MPETACGLPCLKHGAGVIRVGTAGWSIPKQHADAFAGSSHLKRYASRFEATEINSSFYRPHLPKTYERWAASVPEHFRFAVKLPKEITHVRRLAGGEEVLDRFLSEVALLGDKLGPLLVQLPPSSRFDRQVARSFFAMLRERFHGDVVCEPRHGTWFTDEAERMLLQFRIARVAADPARVPHAAQPGGWDEIVYYRLHGSPRMYYSAYTADQLISLTKQLRDFANRCREVWCIFDNTALGEATGNALRLGDCLCQG